MSSKAAMKDAAPREKWWVVLQHQDATVERGSDRPSEKVEPGERMKAVLGPYRSQDAAKAIADKMEYNTARARAERAG